MKDSDPRPMPIEIQRAYRNQIDLRRLLMSSLYDQEDRQDVVDVLMRVLVARHGDVWIMVGNEEMSVSTRLKDRLLKQDVVKAIELLSSIEEYGGSDGVLPLLAQAMQPRWALWWKGFEWTDWDDIRPWQSVARCVLGQRQSAWLAAQYARSVIDRTSPRDRMEFLGDIEAAEQWARVPSEANRRIAAAKSAAGHADDYASIAAWAAVKTATYTHDDSRDVDAMRDAAYAAANAAESDGAGIAYARLADLTRSLITPTLVTSASGRARASGALGAASVVPAAIVGALLGAGAMHFAKRR